MSEQGGCGFDLGQDHVVVQAESLELIARQGRCEVITAPDASLTMEERVNQGEDQAARIGALEERVEALSGTLKTVLTTLVIRGIFTREAVAQILAETKTVVQPGQGKAAAEIDQIQQDLPNYMRAAMGPPPDPDEDDH
jgi:hypothetical protein